MIKMQGVTRTFMLGGVELPVLRGVDLSVDQGEFLSILGASGCGKSTLLNIVGLLDLPTSGSYELNGQAVQNLDDNALSATRNREIGFVFQNFNLLPRLSALENVEMPLVYRGEKKTDTRVKALELLERVGLGDRSDHRPNQLSGGQQQRVAIARALVGSPAVLLADEPTGALDSASGRDIMELFTRMNLDRGLTIIMITHDLGLSRMAGRSVHMRDGVLAEG